MSDYQLIDQPEALASVCETLRGCDWIALDTEFIREKTFYPKLCLIQVATPQLEVFCIDPLAVAIDVLEDVLHDDRILKVMHAARQDMEIFHQSRQVLPGPVFDTQIAAPLLGYPDQVGYAGLVKERLGIDLAKGHSRTDWQQRPLSTAQLQYAADDVRYLAELFPALRQELTDLGRLEWLQPDFDALLDPELYIIHPEQAWRRIKAATKLKGPSLAILQDLAAWRETQAQSQDKPRKWILADDTLVTIARTKPTKPADLERVRGLNPGFIRHHGDTLLHRIAAARDRKPEPLPEFTRLAALEPAQEAAVDLLAGVLRVVAQLNGINPSVLGARKDLERLIRGDRDIPLLQGWREKMAGRILEAVLAGDIEVRVEAGRLRLDPPLNAPRPAAGRESA